jgi:hypothetical protein
MQHIVVANHMGKIIEVSLAPDFFSFPEEAASALRSWRNLP